MRNKLVIGVGTIYNRHNRNDIIKKFCSIFRHKNIITQQIKKTQNLFVLFLKLNVCKCIHFTKMLKNSIYIKSIHIFEYDGIGIRIFEEI